MLTHSVIDALAEKRLGRGGELWLPDALDQVAHTEPVLVHEIKGRWFTTGAPLNFIKTTVEFALAREDLGPALATYLRKLDLSRAASQK